MVQELVMFEKFVNSHLNQEITDFKIRETKTIGYYDIFILNKIMKFKYDYNNDYLGNFLKLRQQVMDLIFI